MFSPESHEPDAETRATEGPAEEATSKEVADALLDLAREQVVLGRAIVDRFNKIDEHFGEIDERFDKIDIHLGYLRGAHAANAARRNTSLIADDMGYQVISRLPREELIGFSNMARDAGKLDSDVRSFREADLVLLVRDGTGQPAYIAVEASFSVAGKDINRAKRNAEYLHEFTGLPAKGAVAGVDIASGREKYANDNDVHCYHIPVKDLESD